MPETPENGRIGSVLVDVNVNLAPLSVDRQLLENPTLTSRVFLDVVILPTFGATTRRSVLACRVVSVCVESLATAVTDHLHGVSTLGVASPKAPSSGATSG